jgi:putative sigma-54 modulation protein
MSTHITGKNIDLTDALKAYVHKKLESVHRHFDNIIAVDVEVDKNMHHKKGDVHHVRINVQIPDHVLHAEETETDMYAAIDLCAAEIDRQVLKQKEKKQTARRQEQKAKRDLKMAQE